MMISGGRTKQLDIFCRITGFTSDFLSFIVVELIRFFHGAIQLCVDGDVKPYSLTHSPWVQSQARAKFMRCAQPTQL